MKQFRGAGLAGLVVAASIGTVFAAAPLPAAASTTAAEVVFVRKTAGQTGGAILRMPAGGGTPTPFVARHQCPGGCFNYDPVTHTSVDPLINAANPAIAPDGSQLRFEAPDGMGRLQFSMMVIVKFTPTEDELGFDQGVFGIAWSPDSRTVAFSKLRGATAATDIWTVAPETVASGTGESIVTTNAMSPTYSPSGQQIAFVRAVNGVRGGLWIMNADGTGATRVAGPVDATDPQWSPDGSRIAYVESGNGNPGIYVVPPRGGSPKKVGNGVDPSWSADSKTLLYAAGPAAAAGELASDSIFSVSVSGGVPTQLTTPVGQNYSDSAPIYFGPAEAKDTTRPGAVEGLTAAPAGSAIDLAWTPPGDDDLAGVEVRQLAGVVPPTSTTGTVVYSGYRPSATVPVSAGSTYSYAAFAFDASGNVAQTPATRTVTAVVLPRVAVPAATATNAAALPFHVAWSGDPGAHFRVRYAARLWTGHRWITGPWRTWKADTTETSGVFGAANAPETVRAGRTYLFDIGVFDTYGNVSKARTATRATVPFDDGQREITYSKGWTGRRAPGHWLGTEHVTTTAGSSVVLRTSASGFILIGDTGPLGGIVNVYVDGSFEARVDTYSRKLRVRKTLFVSDAVAPTGPRTLRLVTARAGIRSRVVIDAVAVVR